MQFFEGYEIVLDKIQEQMRRNFNFFGVSDWVPEKYHRTTKPNGKLMQKSYVERHDSDGFLWNAGNS